MQRRIQDLEDAYQIEHLRLRHSYSTKEHTRRVFRMLREALGNVPLCKLTKEHAEEFQMWLLNRYPSASSVNTFMATVRPPFRWAMRKDPPWLHVDVFKVPKVPVTEERTRIYTPAEFDAMCKAATPLWLLRVNLAKQCGLRKSEVVHLRFVDVDFERLLLCVQPRKQSLSQLRWQPKGKKSRTVPLPESLAKRIKQRRQELPVDQPYFCMTDLRYWRLKQMLKTRTLSERVSASPDDNFHSFKVILRRARVADGTFHDLRRTYGTEMAEGGVPQHELAYLMGHANPETTAKFYIKIRQGHAIERARLVVNAVSEPYRDALNVSNLTHLLTS